MVHRLRRQWGTSKGTVSLGTQLRGVRSKTCQKAAADRPPGTHHSPSISGLNSSSSALRLDRLLRLRWLTARRPTPSHLTPLRNAPLGAAYALQVLEVSCDHRHRHPWRALRAM